MKTIKVQLLNPTLNIIIAAVTFVIFLPLLFLIFSRYLPSTFGPALVLMASVLLSGLAAKYLSRGTGKIEIADTFLRITVYNEYLNRDYLYVINRSEINAFEIYKDKYFTRLVFYKHRAQPKGFTLIAKKEYQDELVDFLKQDVRVVDKKATLSGATFLSAFGGSVVNLSVIMTGVVGSYLIMNWLYYSATGTVIHINIIYWISLTVIFLIGYNKLHYKKNFRLAGRNFTWFIVLIATTVIYFTLIPASYSTFQKPLKVNALTRTVFDYSQKFFIPNKVLTDPAQIGYAYRIHNRRKSNVHTVTHFFTTPVLDPRDPGALDHHIFIAKSYSQRVQKVLSTKEKNKLRQEFMNKKALSFKQEAETAKFYEVLHHENNTAFRNNRFLRSALSTRHVKQPIVIVQGHNESFAELQKSETRRILIGGICILAALLLNSLVIAFNR